MRNALASMCQVQLGGKTNRRGSSAQHQRKSLIKRHWVKRPSADIEADKSIEANRRSPDRAMNLHEN